MNVGGVRFPARLLFHIRLIPEMHKQIKTIAINLMAIAIFISFTSCVTTGPGGKKSFMIIGSGQEVELGKGINEGILKDNELLDDSLWQAYVNEVGQKVVAVCDRKDIEYHFAVINSDQVNAFALPGGYLYFYTGLLKKMDNEAQMAAVISHEISHVVARHGMKRLQTALIAQLGYAIVFGSESSQLTEAAVAIGMTLVFSGYSRSAEREADRYGILYMSEVGYNPEGAVQMFEVLAAAGERDPNVFEKLVASHPETQERINLARQQITQMAPLPENLTFSKDRYQTMKARLK